MTISDSREVATDTSGGTAVLLVESLGKEYNQGRPDAKRAVESVSFEVRAGEFVCVVGPSGAGKTTLLRCLSGLSAPTSGRVTFNGTTLDGVPDDMAIVFQDYGRSLFPWFKVGQNVALPLRLAGVGKAERAERVADALESVGLGDAEDRYPWQLSGGMQQRVAIARALVGGPKLMMLDEPFASVDAQTRFELEDLLLRLRSQRDLTLVLVTHDIDEAVYLGDRVVVLGSSPSVVVDTVSIDLPRPRDQLSTRNLPDFGSLRTRILDTLMNRSNT